MYATKDIVEYAPGVGEDSAEGPGPEGPNSTLSPPELPSTPSISSDLSIRSDNTVTGRGDLPAGIVSIFSTEELDKCSAGLIDRKAFDSLKCEAWCGFGPERRSSLVLELKLLPSERNAV